MSKSIEDLLYDKENFQRKSIWDYSDVGCDNTNSVFGKVERCYNDAKLSITVDSYDFIAQLLEWKSYDDNLVVECHKNLQKAMYDAIKPLLDYYVAKEKKKEQEKKEKQELEKKAEEKARHITQEEYDKNVNDAKQCNCCSCDTYLPNIDFSFNANIVTCKQCGLPILSYRKYLYKYDGSPIYIIDKEK